MAYILPLCILTALVALLWDSYLAPFRRPLALPRADILLQNLAHFSSDDDKGELRVAVGYNANLDLVVDAVKVFQILGANLSAPSSFQDHEQISSFEELFSSFGHWFSRGGAAERYVASPGVFLELLQVAKQAGCAVALGGNAGLMANAMAQAGHQVLLGSVYNEHIKSLLHAGVSLTMSEAPRNGQLGDAEGLYHLILEYPKGATIFGKIAPRANRMILIRDHLNSRLESLRDFHTNLVEFGPDVAVVSGLHLLSGLPFEEQERQVKAVVHGLSTIPSSVPIHLELASMADMRLMSLVVHNVFPYVDSLGLNEQELNATIVALDTQLGPGVIPSDHRGISSALQALQTIFSAFRFPAWSAHFLTRIHFHCLAFHTIIQRKDINGRNRWAEVSDSVLQGARTASVRACGKDGRVNAEDVELHFQQAVIPLALGTERFELNMETPVTGFDLAETSGMSFAVAPVAVCKKPTHTVGLGDAISAAGLVRHIKLVH